MSVLLQTQGIHHITLNGADRKKLNLKGSELISILNLEKVIEPGDNLTVDIKYASRLIIQVLKTEDLWIPSILRNH